MSKYPFALNGVDFSDVVNKYGYETDRVPVFSTQWTDLAGVDHDVRLRDKGVLYVTLNDIDAERSAQLCEQLRRHHLMVKYHSFQLGREVEEHMRITSMPRSLLMIDGGVTVHSAELLTLEQK